MYDAAAGISGRGPIAHADQAAITTGGFGGQGYSALCHGFPDLARTWTLSLR